MSLDIIAVASQVRQMGQDIATAQSDFRDCVRWARLLLQQHSERYKEVAAAVRESKESRTARASLPMDEPLAFRRQAPPLADSYVAAAADGSQAEPDRHGHVNYFLINTGTALIAYGNEPAASFRTVPRLYYKNEDLHVVEERQADWKPDQQPREALIDGEILAMKRSVAEIEDLLRLAENIPPALPSLLVVDGTLTLFAKTTGADAWVGDLLVSQYQAALEAIHDKKLPIAGFISRSNASWVMDMLQVGVCGRESEDCAFCRSRPQDGKAACAMVGLRDRFLYDSTIDEPGVPAPLKPGERGAVFQ